MQLPFRASLVLALCSLALVLTPGCDPGASMNRARRDGGPNAPDTGPVLADSDGDGIPDVYEGAATNVDTDHDGRPDYLDTDSDGDDVSDMLEGGNPGGMPRDSDHDGTPDFRDLDSDGNGIPDMTEGPDDLDGDRIPNADDLDDDGDHINDVDEIGPDPSMPLDSDHDGVPDFRDVDSDNDTISDSDESVVDTDMDGTVDRLDLDSDNDTLPDANEAGDADLSTPPIDTDGDRIPDFRDTDSDADGLSDQAEAAAGTSPTNADSDGDGVSDLVEVASGTNPLDGSDSPRTHGNFVFVEPYMMPPAPLRDTLDFATNIRSADVYFLIDTTGSMGSTIANVQSSLSSTGGIIDQIRTMISDAQFGVGDFKDSVDPYVYRNDTSITASASAAQAGVNSLSANGGGDEPEGDVGALYSAASGAAITSTPARTGCPTGTFGYPCFRSGAVPIIVVVTDAHFHNERGGGYANGAYADYATMLGAITAHHIRVMGVAVGATPQADLDTIATDSGAVDGSGAPLVTVTSAGSVSTTVVDQVRTLSMATHFSISTAYQDDPSDAVDTRTAFVDYIEANTAGDSTRGCAPRAATDTDGDGHLDTFPDVTSGERVCFDIVVKQNDTVMPLTTPQLFNATLQVIGDGFTVLDSRTITFLVPPTVPPPGGPG